MLQRILNNKLKTFLVIVFVLLLAAIRGYEDALFYDPFSGYFKSDYLTLKFPHYEAGPLFFGMLLRYFLNTILSLAIIQIIFSDWELTRFAAFLYLFLFVFLIAAFFMLLYYSDSSNNFVLFYVRRFLIQPLFLLLFVPAFYYQRHLIKK